MLHLITEAPSVGNTTDGVKSSSGTWLLTSVLLLLHNQYRVTGTCRDGIRRYEIDVLYYLLRGLSLCSVVWDLREIPRRGR